MKKYDITSLGEILIDFTNVGTKDGNKLFQQNPGGAPANVAVASAKLGSKTTFIGKVGLDIHGTFLKGVLEDNNVNTDNLILDKEFFTTLAFVDINNGERIFSFNRNPGADTQLGIKEINIENIKQSRILHVGSLSLTHEPSRNTTYEAIKIARENNVIVSYDPNYRESLWDSKDIAIKYMNSIIPDIIKVSEEEIELLTNNTNYEEAANILFNKGIKIVIITLGDKGCYIQNKEGSVFIAGLKCNVVDTTGAGDSFIGAFLSKLDNINKPLNELFEIGLFANATASLCVEKVGAIPSLPTIDEVNKRLKK